MVLGQVLGTSCPGSLPSWSVHKGAVFTPNPTSSLIRSTGPPKKAARLTIAVTVHGEPLVWHQATLYSTLHPFCVTIGHRGGLLLTRPICPQQLALGVFLCPPSEPPYPPDWEIDRPLLAAREGRPYGPMRSGVWSLCRDPVLL